MITENANEKLLFSRKKIKMFDNVPSLPAKSF